MYEVVVMNEERFGIDGVEVVENIYQVSNAVYAKRFKDSLEFSGFRCIVRRFECSPVFPSEFSKVIEDLKKRSAPAPQIGYMQCASLD